MKWSDDQIETLKGLVGQGFSASQIGKEFGVTRNAVIGKVHRTGLDLKRKRGSDHKPRRRRRQAKPWGKTIVPRFAPIELEEVDDAVAVTFAELANHCRWPVAGEGYRMLYCGGPPIAGLPYCAHHCRIAYIKGRPA